MTIHAQFFANLDIEGYKNSLQKTINSVTKHEFTIPKTILGFCLRANTGSCLHFIKDPFSSFDQTHQRKIAHMIDDLLENPISRKIIEVFEKRGEKIPVVIFNHHLPTENHHQFKGSEGSIYLNLTSAYKDYTYTLDENYRYRVIETTLATVFTHELFHLLRHRASLYYQEPIFAPHLPSTLETLTNSEEEATIFGGKLTTLFQDRLNPSENLVRHAAHLPLRYTHFGFSLPTHIDVHSLNALEKICMRFPEEIFYLDEEIDLFSPQSVREGLSDPDPLAQNIIPLSFCILKQDKPLVEKMVSLGGFTINLEGGSSDPLLAAIMMRDLSTIKLMMQSSYEPLSPAMKQKAESLIYRLLVQQESLIEQNTFITVEQAAHIKASLMEILLFLSIAQDHEEIFCKLNFLYQSSR